MRLRRYACCLLPLFVALATPASALAHASYVRSQPADVCGPLAVPRLPDNDPRCQTGVVLQSPPTAVKITFSEPVQLVGRGIRVLAPTGKAAATGKATVVGDQASVALDASQTGTYVVEWQVESADTHPARGRFAFSVGEPSAAVAGLGGGDVGQVTALGLGLQALGRWLHFAGFALAFGTLAFVLLLPAAGAGVWRLVNAGIVLLLVAEPLAVFGQTASFGVDQIFDPDALLDALSSNFGRLLAFRFAAALLLWVLTGSAPSTHVRRGDRERGEDSTGRPGERVVAGIGAGIGLALAGVDGLSAHSASFQPVALGLLVHGLHLSAMGVWLGGLAALLMAWPAAKAAGVQRHLLVGFGKIAAGSVGVLAVTGVAMAAVHLTTPVQLIATDYGRVLAGKQLVFCAACALAFAALRRAKQVLWRAELTALVVLIGVAGLLVSLPPPR